MRQRTSLNLLINRAARALQDRVFLSLAVLMDSLSTL